MIGSYKIIWSDESVKNLDSIIDYLEQNWTEKEVKKFINQADKYFDTFFEYFEIISHRPFSFESVVYIKKGYRRCVCGSDSIYCKINEDIVEIMAIVGRQDLSDIL